MRHLIAIAAIPALIACADASIEIAANEPVTAVASEVEKAEAFDFSTLSAGTYTDENGHAYIQFSYDHQGYSRPVLRWSEFDATVNFDPEAPENSTLNVTIPAASIDSMVPAFNEHLKSADFFEVKTYPTITFVSTDMDINPDGTGTITGNLTIKDITRPITFDGKINKAGKSRSGADMFGISGTGQLKRSDYGVGKYVPNVGDDVQLVMEVEFQKAE
ncbi:MAG: YceI family protein [Litorimonas sp.]